MASIAKTIVATGVSSGLGFEAIKQLLETSQPYRVILGARNNKKAEEDYDKLKYDSRHTVTVLPLELSDLRTVKTFAQQTLDTLGQDKIDYLLLNAGMADGAQKAGPRGSKWCEPYLVNHLSQHYLPHLLHDKLVESKSRIIFVSSGAVRHVSDTSVLDNDLKAGSGADGFKIYPQSKFANLLAAHWWRRRLAGQATVVAVSPGLIPDTGISRNFDLGLNINSNDAKGVPEGGANVLRAFTRDDFPEDPERIFLTSWGEWWPKDVYEKSLDKALQDAWCPSKEQIEQEEGVSA